MPEDKHARKNNTRKIKEAKAPVRERARITGCDTSEREGLDSAGPHASTPNSKQNAHTGGTNLRMRQPVIASTVLPSPISSEGQEQRRQSRWSVAAVVREVVSVHGGLATKTAH